MGANLPPESGIRVPAEALSGLVHALFDKVGMNDTDAGVMADLLVATDLRAVFSHGTQQTRGYVRMIREGRVNARPNIQVAATTTTTRVYDGDGGMGHLPSWQAANFVADTGNSQIHVWSKIADALDGQSADIVLGEASFEDTTPEIKRDKTFWPAAPFYDGELLWVGEFKFSNRLLRFAP